MTTPNQCQFWDCDETLNRRDHFLCYDHYTGYQEGRIDECPQCGSYKRVNYPACRNCERQPAAAPPGGSPDAALLEELRVLRRNLARTYELQEFMVFSNATLDQLAAVRPTTERAMLEISGIGPAKMERYGADVLRVIRASVSAPPGRASRRPAAASRAGRQTDAATNRPQSSVQDAEPQTDDPRKRYPAETRTDDGHYVRSRGEAMVDNWLYSHHIAHAYERKLPVEENAISDFYLPQGRVYIEVWGMEEVAAYAHRMREKLAIYRRNDLRLIELKGTELNSLDDHLPRLLRDFGIRID